MPSDLDLSLGSPAGRIAGAILFIQASTNAMDVYSALNSSPWTAESFGGDARKAAACREYVRHSVGVSGFYCISAGVLARNGWPIIGWAIASAYMYWLYDRALKRAQSSGSQSWDDKGTQQPGRVNGSEPTQVWSP